VTERASPPSTATIRELDVASYRAAIPGLSRLVVDAVESGAGVNFMAGVTEDEAAAWWTERVDLVANGTISAFVAFDGSEIVGSAILIRSRNANSPHRAEVGKVLVHRSARRRGIGAALMRAVEARARTDGRWLLILDTVTGSAAEAMYRALGWTELGVMPNHALLPDGRPAATTYFWKDLR
jgi:GNAT superfamily N-acetyltransferase